MVCRTLLAAFFEARAAIPQLSNKVATISMGDDFLELAKAKKLANVMGGAWHSEEWDADSDSEQQASATAAAAASTP